MPKKKLKTYEKYLNVDITIHLSNFTAYKGYITEIRDRDFVFVVNQKIVKTKIKNRVYYDTRDFRDTILISPQNIVKFAYVHEKSPLPPQNISQPQQVQPITIAPLANQEPIPYIPLNSLQSPLDIQTILHNHPNYPSYPQPPFPGQNFAQAPSTNGSLYDGNHNSFELSNLNEARVQYNANMFRQNYYTETLMNEPLDSQNFDEGNQKLLNDNGGFFFRQEEQLFQQNGNEEASGISLVQNSNHQEFDRNYWMQLDDVKLDKLFQQNSNEQASGISLVQNSNHQEFDRTYWMKLDDAELQQSANSLSLQLDELKQRYQSADTFFYDSNEETLGINNLRINEEEEDCFERPQFDKNSPDMNSESLNGYGACANVSQIVTDGCENLLEQQVEEKEFQDGSQNSLALEESKEEEWKNRFEQKRGDCVYYYDNNYQYFPEPRHFPSTAFDSTTFNVSKKNRFGKNKSIVKFEKSSKFD